VRACLVVFDIFAVAGKDLRFLPYEDRRHRLTKRLRRVDEPLALMPPPTAPAHAAVWLRSTRPPALRCGRQSRSRTPTCRAAVDSILGPDAAEAVIGGVTGPLDAPTGLIVGGIVHLSLMICLESTSSERSPSDHVNRV
jgi:hypothetical protein